MLREAGSSLRDLTMLHCWLWRWNRGSQAKAYKWLLEATKNKEIVLQFHGKHQAAPVTVGASTRNAALQTP